MPKKERFSAEADTQPAIRRATAPSTRTHPASGPVPKSRPTATEVAADTSPHWRSGRAAPRRRGSGPKGRPQESSEIAGASIDEVVADLSRDPRRESDD